MKNKQQTHKQITYLGFHKIFNAWSNTRNPQMMLEKQSAQTVHLADLLLSVSGASPVVSPATDLYVLYTTQLSNNY